MNTIRQISRLDCTGCGVCASGCPVGCIHMVPDGEGFAFPQVDGAACLECGRCLEVCPTGRAQGNTPLFGRAAMNLGPAHGFSSSGGMFHLLASAWIEGGGWICAAGMTDELECVHMLTDDGAVLPSMQGSKYVQSSLSPVLGPMEELLKAGKEILFFGTPCQAAGVGSRFGRYRRQLCLVDLVCHGVPSSGMFREYMSRRYPGITGPVRFRYRTNYEASVFGFQIPTDRGLLHVDGERDPYYAAFLDGVSYRESCYRCGYACGGRVGDITIGDCATAARYSGFPYGKSVSTVLVNTPRGEDLWNRVSSGTINRELDVRAERAQNHQLSHPSPRPAARDEFYRDWRSMEPEAFCRKYLKPIPVKKHLKRCVQRMIPLSVKGSIKGLLKGKKR